MITKLKTRYDAIMNNTFAQGLIVGGVTGSVATLGFLIATKANFTDPEKTLHIPDHLVDHILECGMPVLITRHDGTQLSIGPS